MNKITLFFRSILGKKQAKKFIFLYKNRISLKKGVLKRRNSFINNYGVPKHRRNSAETPLKMCFDLPKLVENIVMAKLWRAINPQ